MATDINPVFGILKFYTERESDTNKYRGTDSETSVVMNNNDVESAFVAPLSIGSNQPQFASDSLSLKRFSYSQPVQRWEIEANLMPRNDGHFMLMHSVRYGYSDEFDIRMPQQYIDGTTNSDFKTVNAEALAGADTLVLNNVTGISRGEFVRFQGHSKVYLIWLVTPGDSKIYVRPHLTTTVQINKQVYRGGNVVMKAKYDDSVQLGIKYVDGILADPGSVKFIEAL